MKCPNCGSLAQHIITDINGQCYFKCTNLLSRLKLEKRKGHIVFHHIPRVCETVLDDKGRKFSGYVAFMSGGELQSIKL